MIAPILPGTAPSSIAACVVPAPMRSTPPPAVDAGIVRQMAQVGDRVGLRQAKIEQRPQRLRAGARPRAGGEKLSASGQSFGRA